MAVDQSKNLLRLIFLYIIKYLKEQTEFLNRNAILFIGARKLKAQVVLVRHSVLLNAVTDLTASQSYGAVNRPDAEREFF